MIEKFNDDCSYDFFFDQTAKNGLWKFLKEMNMDLSTDIKFDKKVYGKYRCVCGQPIKKGFLLHNRRNGKTCVVGNQCYGYIKDYLGWK